MSDFIQWQRLVKSRLKRENYTDTKRRGKRKETLAHSGWVPYLDILNKHRAVGKSDFYHIYPHVSSFMLFNAAAYFFTKEKS